MSEEREESDLRHPRETGVLYGHVEAERTLLDSFRGGRMPHAWLIGGPPGIGKATLAYRFARFVLAHPDAHGPDVAAVTSLAVPENDPVARRVATATHAGVLTLERRLNDKGRLMQDIAVDDVRRLVPFFGSTAGEGGWRIAIVDAVDELNRSGANAILKLLEEPPQRSLLLLVSHAPGRTLPTIRSRCRRLDLRPLAQNEVCLAAGKALGRAPTDPEIMAAAQACDGSVARALALLDGNALALREKTLGLLAQLPAPDPRALHALGDALAGSEPQTLTAFMDVINEWLSTRLETMAREARRAARIAETWDAVNRAARDAQTYNLDRKPLVFSVFGLLAEAARG
ncbi:MAG: DNA polymerase III subunit delta' [Pseudolabrys sp.]